MSSHSQRLAAHLLVSSLVLGTGCSGDEKKPEGSSSSSSSVSTAPAGNVDMRDYLQSTLIVPWPKDGAGVAAGQWIEIRNTTADPKDPKAAKSSAMRVAVVADAGQAFKIEESATSEAFLGFIEGLTVEKATGHVTEAIAAKKGEKGKAIKLGPAPTAATSAGTATDENVTVAAGTFPATKTVIAGQLSETATWVGKDGEAAGIPLKESSDDTVLRELKSLTTEDATIAGKSQKTLHAVYSDGSETWFVRGVAVPFYGSPDGKGTTWVKQSRGGTTTELTWGSDAKPEIDWAK